MEKSLIVLQNGMKDEVDILSEFEMDAVMGGEVDCAKKYKQLDDGTVSCGCGYIYTPTPPGGHG